MDRIRHNDDEVEVNNDPIQYLKREHEDTLRRLESAKRALQSLRCLPGNIVPHQREAEENWIKVFVVSLVSRIRLHFQKEEEGLFPILAEYIGKEHGPIEVMLHEHEILRLTFHDWEELLVQFCKVNKGGKKDALNAVISTGDEALRLFRLHSSKENKILFEICEASLSDEEKNIVAERIEDIGLGRSGKT
ncbi:MAG: hemerythrin domain-containing protein [Nitrospira sp.]|nr:hypothetical protein [Candidatus Manganitrophaceae bacterium]HIL35181.1 hypothetical protein [Candidatus Manganitrophaceae bacterium]